MTRVSIGWAYSYTSCNTRKGSGREGVTAKTERNRGTLWDKGFGGVLLGRAFCEHLCGS